MLYDTHCLVVFKRGVVNEVLPLTTCIRCIFVFAVSLIFQFCIEIAIQKGVAPNCILKIYFLWLDKIVSKVYVLLSYVFLIKIKLKL